MSTALAHYSGDTPCVRTLWCIACASFTPHLIEYHGTLSVEDHHIVAVRMTCKAAYKIGKEKMYCDRVTNTYLRVSDYNALITRPFY